MNVFITGATGYIGGAVIRALRKRGDTVQALIRHADQAKGLPPGTTTIVGDLKAPDAWLDRLPTVDAFIHTAFPDHGDSWADAVRIEQTFFLHLAAALDGQDTRVVVSNGTVFLGDSGNGRLSETSPVQDGHPAAIRAQSVRAILESLPRSVELRLASFVYGNGGSVFLPALLANARRTRKSLVIRGYENVRTSALHVDAAAHAYLNVLDSPDAHGVYHVASEEEPAVAEIAQVVAAATGPDCSVLAVDPNEAAQRLDAFTAMFLSTNNRLDSCRIRELGWNHAGFTPLLYDVAFGSYRLEIPTRAKETKTRPESRPA